MTQRSPRTRVAVVLIQDDQILLVQHRKGAQTYWLLPGGGLDFGESIHACAVRELVEETGLHIAVTRFLYLSESIAPDGSRHILNIYVLGELVGGAIQAPVNDIISDVQWMPLSSLPDLAFYPAIAHELLDSFRNGFAHDMRYLRTTWVDMPAT